MTTPTERMLRLGKIAFLRYSEVRGGKNHDGTDTPPWEALGKGIQVAWAEAALVLFNTGVLATGVDPSKTAGEQQLDPTGLGWRKRALVAEDSEQALRTERDNLKRSILELGALP